MAVFTDSSTAHPKQAMKSFKHDAAAAQTPEVSKAALLHSNFAHKPVQASVQGAGESLKAQKGDRHGDMTLGLCSVWPAASEAAPLLPETLRMPPKPQVEKMAHLQVIMHSEASPATDTASVVWDIHCLVLVDSSWSRSPQCQALKRHKRASTLSPGSEPGACWVQVTTAHC